MSKPATRRRKKVIEEEHVNHERWLVSYADLITVMMALFIVLFAISQVDEAKYAALRDSLAAGFNPGTQLSSVLAGSDGVMDGMSSQTDRNDPDSSSSLVDADQGLGQQGVNPKFSPGDPVVAAARVELSHLDAIRDAMADALDERGLSSQVTFRMSERGLIVGLVASDVFFAAESARLSPTAVQVLSTLAPTLAAAKEDISVEGHANIVPTSGRYATNWELSSDRATQVVRHLVEVNGLPGVRLEAVGFGDTRPLMSGNDEASLAANRRVDVVILSDAPEAVRALLPVLAASE
ncbi:MAG: OmpA family protein [Micrococcales bacterium]|nr:OmpA family protein [Micrococcales bacterium]